MNFKERLAIIYVKLVKTYRIVIINSFCSLVFKKNTDIKKILINRDGAFGDSIVAMPAINLIRNNYPDARIDLLSINNDGISFKDIGIEDKIIDNLYNITKRERKKTLKHLRQEAYDLFIQLPQNIGLYKSIRNILLVRYLLRIPVAFGWDYGRVKSFMKYQKKHEAIPTETQRFLDTLKLNRFVGDNIVYPLTSKKPNEKKLAKLLETTSPIAFLIGGKLQPKKWPLNHWKSLIKLIGEKQYILIIGGNDEFEEGEEIKSGQNNVINLCGKLSITELRYTLSKCSVSISLDTGAMHLCDTTNTKQIVLFSTRDLSNKWFPNNKNSMVLEKVINCSFCLKTECLNNICMSNILPNEVYSEMKKVLSN